MKQAQFLQVVDRDEAAERMRAALEVAFGGAPDLGAETVPLAHALHRVLAEDVASTVDVPGFDRANLDGFAVRAADTNGATEAAPRELRLAEERVRIGAMPGAVLAPGEAMTIPTGGAMPRGADAVLMVEHTALEGDIVTVRRSITAGTAVSFAGTDIARGEVLVRRGQRLTSREIGVLAAVGRASVSVRRCPRVAVLSTGDEIIAPGTPIAPGQIYDANLAIVCAAVTEAGGIACPCGIVRDDHDALAAALRSAIDDHDVVLLSGGTSKGPGDLAAGVLDAVLSPPGVLVHGVALRPGKPLCLALSGRTPVIVLPGFPTSAIFTFVDLVAPIIRAFAGHEDTVSPTVTAELAVRLRSDPGRREYQLTHLVPTGDDASREGAPREGVPREGALLAYPIGKGSGSITTWSQADGYFVVPRHTEQVAAGSEVEVFAIAGARATPDDLIFIGSHCVGLDVIVGALIRDGVRCKVVAVGSEAGLAAAKRRACDVAPVHLFDTETRSYNRPFLTDDLRLVPGYRRKQGVVYRKGDLRFEGRAAKEAVGAAATEASCVMINRNRGSGTRALYDELLGEQRPDGHAVQASSHHAVAAAVAQGRADWGIAIDVVARDHGIGFLPLTEEHFDFVVPVARWARPAVQTFVRILARETITTALQGRGFSR